MSEPEEEPITVAREGAVAVVTMDRPRRRNALGTRGVRALVAALDELAGDGATRAVLLRGSPPAFCAGSDLKELGPLSVEGMCAHERETAAAVRRIGQTPLPVVAAVEGYALGGGCALALACDVVVTGRGARWAMPEVANGWLPPWGLRALVARVGPVRARLVVWGAMEIDGAEAHRLGMADALAEDGGAEAEAQRIAARLAELPPEAVRSTKRYFEAETMADAERQDMEALRLFASDAASETARATLERFRLAEATA